MVKMWSSGGCIELSCCGQPKSGCMSCENVGLLPRKLSCSKYDRDVAWVVVLLVRNGPPISGNISFVSWLYGNTATTRRVYSVR